MASEEISQVTQMYFVLIFITLYNYNLSWKLQRLPFTPLFYRILSLKKIKKSVTFSNTNCLVNVGYFIFGNRCYKHTLDYFKKASNLEAFLKLLLTCYSYDQQIITPSTSLK